MKKLSREERAFFDARAELEEWTFAAKYVGLLTDAARVFGHEQTLASLEQAEATALHAKANAQELLAEAERELQRGG